MIWILATRGASTKLREPPGTESPIEGVHSVVYRPGIQPIANDGSLPVSGAPGTFERGLNRISGYVFSYHGSAAEELLGITAAIDLIIRYRSHNGQRKRTLTDVIFIGDAVVTVPAINSGVSVLTGVPFRVQLPEYETLDDHVVDTLDT